LDVLPESVRWFKIGLELFTSEGPAAIAPVVAAGKHVFLDAKLHDIPRTVAHAVASAAHHGVALVTVHASGGREMLRAATQSAAAAGTGLRVVAVTTLTSLGPSDLRDIGVTRTLADHALALGEMAVQAGAHGLVTSVHEAAALRSRFGRQILLVTPGIRPAGSSADDQRRIASPAAAVRAGADLLVVGRPILESRDPRATADAILDEMRQSSGTSPA
jgi:orotidine-5'-phosphate decarboxylase